MEAAFMALPHGLLEFDKIISKRAEMYRNVRRFILRLVSDLTCWRCRKRHTEGDSLTPGHACVNLSK